MLRKSDISFLYGNKTNHQSPNLDKPKDFNVDGTLHYAKHFKDKFDTLFLVVSGTERKDCKISFGVWKKKQRDLPIHWRKEKNKK